jgi:hypothetical protein
MFPLKILVGAAALAAIFDPGFEGPSHVRQMTGTQPLPAEGPCGKPPGYRTLSPYRCRHRSRSPQSLASSLNPEAPSGHGSRAASRRAEPIRVALKARLRGDEGAEKRGGCRRLRRLTPRSRAAAYLTAALEDTVPNEKYGGACDGGVKKPHRYRPGRVVRNAVRICEAGDEKPESQEHQRHGTEGDLDEPVTAYPLQLNGLAANRFVHHAPTQLIVPAYAFASHPVQESCRIDVRCRVTGS